MRKSFARLDTKKGTPRDNRKCGGKKMNSPKSLHGKLRKKEKKFRPKRIFKGLLQVQPGLRRQEVRWKKYFRGRKELNVPPWLSKKEKWKNRLRLDFGAIEKGRRAGGGEFLHLLCGGQKGLKS